ncbi:MAG TPA: Fe-S cluster assembly protein SufD [Thermoanaerobaculia bacterium]|jgi:Fe-S cluster assembly protein SufD|nr:Fe-S cluster assembly protein SufD [Thermoanaerobaculia bacterium]
MTATETQAPAALAPYLADFERYNRERLDAGVEPAFVQALRRAGLERFAALGFPTTKQEEWRLTNVGPIAQGTFHRSQGDPNGIVPEQIAPYDFPAAARLVFVDGRYSSRLSSSTGLPSGVVVTSLAAALAASPELVEPWLGQLASFEQQPFVALNTAFLGDGAFIHVPRGATSGLIHVLFLSSSEDGRATVSYPRNLFVAGENSQLTVVETYAGTGAYFNCPVTELVAGRNSVVDHYKVQRESREAFHMATFQVQGERDSVPRSHSISLGGGLVRNDVNAVLAGEGIDCTLNGLYLVDGRQHVDNHMRVEHAKPHCSSHELYKGVLDGKGRAVFNGLIHVHPGAQKTDAKQSNRNLLISREAVANSNPQLEIYADDVKCTHGSTVGQLDEDAVFYLRSRGIGEEAARSLLTWAFASDIVERIKVEPVRKDLEEFLFARLPKGEIVRQAV